MATLNQRIAALVPNMSGWCSVEKANELALAVLKLKSKVTVEIGVFGGRSLIPMAMAHKEQRSGLVWAIDPWSPSNSVIGQNEVNAEWWGKCDHETIYQQFLTHIKTQGVEDYVRVLRRASDDVIPPHEIDVLHIDGNHSDQTIKDVERYASKVRVGGLCFMDDLHWAPGVETAVDVLKKMGFIHLFDRDTGAMFERVPMKKAKATVAPKKKLKKKGKK